MTESGPGASPVFHWTSHSDWVHLTVVLAELAVARYLQHLTGAPTKKILGTLDPLRAVVVAIGDKVPMSSHQR
ncbi:MULTISPECIES: hypothetical protein [Dietzia]|uniref:hypothetical protein n=1 Tax=Dietzia TaxID=37914 RepID=UPI00101AD25B|nr:MULTISPECIES: hypothetical protein [Dietzia]MCT1712139.1 hypothetical protein [Dietzia cinnamea]MCT2273520.1 hypothetical protein [Dietzia cinnamea]